MMKTGNGDGTLQKDENTQVLLRNLLHISVVINDAGAEHCPEYLHLRLHITRIDGSSNPLAIADVWNTRRRLGLLPDSSVCSQKFGC